MVSHQDVQAYPGDNKLIIGEKYTADGAIGAGAVLARGSSAGTVAEAASGDQVIGVADSGNFYDENGSDQDYEDGDVVRLIADGAVKLEANGSVSAGDKLVADAGGTVVSAATDGTADATEIVGTALEDGTDGDVIRVNLH